MQDLVNSYSVYSRSHLMEPVAAFFLAVKNAVTTSDPLAYADILSLVCFSLVFLWMCTQSRLRQAKVLMLYSAVTLGALFPWHTEVGSSYLSTTRYVLSLFPVFIGIAALILKLPLRWRYNFVLVSTVGLIVIAALYALFFFVG
jgi:hypothetical protein